MLIKHLVSSSPHVLLRIFFLFCFIVLSFTGSDDSFYSKQIMVQFDLDWDILFSLDQALAIWSLDRGLGEVPHQ